MPVMVDSEGKCVSFTLTVFDAAGCDRCARRIRGERAGRDRGGQRRPDRRARDRAGPRYSYEGHSAPASPRTPSSDVTSSLAPSYSSHLPTSSDSSSPRTSARSASTPDSRPPAFGAARQTRERMAVRAALAAPERAAHGRHHRPAGSLREGEERRNLDSLKNTIKANPALAASLAALLLACLALAFAQGCDMRHMNRS